MNMIGKRTPIFKNIELVLDKKVPSRPTLFEFFLNGPLYERLAIDVKLKGDKHDTARYFTNAYKNAGYDYVTLGSSYDFGFPSAEHESKQTISLNGGSLIYDRESFNAALKLFVDPYECDYSMLDAVKDDMPDTMKVISHGPGGVLENVISMVGFDNLCYMIYDDEQLVYDIFEVVGSSLVKFYEMCGRNSIVGAMISNDDWGFKTQTMLSVKDMRKFVFPWHKKIAQQIHKSGRQAILHSCGNYNEIIDDVIYDMKYDGRHSYEDNIECVEKAYERLQGKIAVLGGIDISFVTTATPEEIFARSKAMIDRSLERGGYALGTGNSVPEFIPQENYLAMIRAVLEYDM